MKTVAKNVEKQKVVTKTITKQVQKKSQSPNQIVPKQQQKQIPLPQIFQPIKSHIVFQGHPDYHPDTIEIVPVIIRRKKIFQKDPSKNILPPQLVNHYDSFHDINNHSKYIQNSKIISQNVNRNFGKDIMKFNNTQNSMIRNDYDFSKRRKKLTSQRQEIYLQANNLQTDLNFGLPPSGEGFIDGNVNVSNISEATQKKQGVAFQSQTPFSSNVTTPAANMAFNSSNPRVSFTYQGFSPQKSPPKKITNLPIPFQSSPQKSKTKTIFVNEGGILQSKQHPLNKIQSYSEIKQQSYPDKYQQLNQNILNNFQQLQPQYNTSTIQHNTPSFKNKSLSDNYKSFNSQNYITNMQQVDSNNYTRKTDRLMKKVSNKTVIGNFDDEFIPSPANLNNSSIQSYKSINKEQIHKYFQNNPSPSLVQSKPQKQQLKIINIQRRTSKAQSFVSDPITKKISNKTIKNNPTTNESLIMQLTQQVLNKDKKNQNQSNLSQQAQHGGSLFDNILNQRQSIFNKTKKGEQKLIKKDQQESHSVHKPQNFITDSKMVGKHNKRAIGIKNLVDKSNEKEQRKPTINIQKPNISTVVPTNNDSRKNSMLQSKAKSILLNSQFNGKKSSIDQAKGSTLYNTMNLGDIKNLNNNDNLKKSQLKAPVSSRFKDAINQKIIQKQLQKSFQKIRHSHHHKKFRKNSQKEKRKKQEKRSKDIKKANKKKVEDLIDQYDMSHDEEASLNKLEREDQSEISSESQERPLSQNLNQIQKSDEQEQRQSLQISTSSIKQTSFSQEQSESANSKNSPSSSSIEATYVNRKLANRHKGKRNNNHSPKNPSQNIHKHKKQNDQELESFLINEQQKIKEKQIKKNKSKDKNKSKSKSKNKTNGELKLHHQKDRYEHNPKGEFQTNFPLFQNILSNNISAYQSPVTLSHLNSGIIQHHKLISNALNNPQETDSKYMMITKALYQELNKFIITKNIYNNQNQLIGTKMNNTNIHSKLSPANNSQINKTIHEQLKRFNGQSNQNTRPLINLQQQYIQNDQFNRMNREPGINSSSDETKYYSFYHDEDDACYAKQVDSNYKSFPDNNYITKPSLRQRFAFTPSSMQTRELNIIQKRLQQIQFQISRQLPLIHRQIEENQVQIRSLENHMVIKNRLQQHNTFNILQKMRQKELQLRRKQKEIRDRDHEVGMYKSELNNFRQELKGSEELVEELELQRYYENRLQKIKNYNEKLCTRIARIKGEEGRVY